MKQKPNNYFHVRVYTDDGGKFELFRDKKQPSTRREIIDGLKWAIEKATGPIPKSSDFHKAACYDCDLPYEDFPLDMVLPDAEWRQISPSGDEGGLLCAECIVKRAAKLPGMIVVFARFVVEADHEAFRELKNMPMKRPNS